MELSDRIMKMISKNNNMHFIIPATVSSMKMVKESESEKGDFFIPEMTTEMGKSGYRFQCSHAGWFHCTATNLRFRMDGEGEVLYTTVDLDSSCPVSTNYYAAGPLYDIKCVQGELSQLQLPHCEISPEDDCNFMTVGHYTDDSEEVLTPEYMSHTHVKVTVQGNSRFRLKDIWNLFKSKIRGQVIVMYHPRPKHWLHVFLHPWNVDPKKLCEDGGQRIPGPCDCDLIHAHRYNISCKDIENPHRQQRVQASDGLFLRNKNTDNPTFVIRLEENTMNIKLQLIKDSAKTKVWEYDLPSLKDFQKTLPSLDERTLQTDLVQSPVTPANCSAVVRAEHGSTAITPALTSNNFYGSSVINLNSTGAGNG
ncbi:uncharacterized protein LOC118816714 [Colossoma macropomum]|uniref:uncharacterized protein LOC118816714 n=1 Tax=Colossoma macropomum TaxID=42526 RepID=UPI0018648E99|nr:uncharacterized protein LOC118816714 [Colossoma macropomum]